MRDLIEVMKFVLIVASVVGYLSATLFMDKFVAAYEMQYVVSE